MLEQKRTNDILNEIVSVEVSLSLLNKENSIDIEELWTTVKANLKLDEKEGAVAYSLIRERVNSLNLGLVETYDKALRELLPDYDVDVEEFMSALYTKTIELA